MHIPFHSKSKQGTQSCHSLRDGSNITGETTHITYEQLMKKTTRKTRQDMHAGRIPKTKCHKQMEAMHTGKMRNVQMTPKSITLEDRYNACCTVARINNNSSCPPCKRRSNAYNSEEIQQNTAHSPDAYRLRTGWLCT